MNIIEEFYIKRKIESLKKEKVELLDFVLENVGHKIDNPEDYLQDFKVFDRKIKYLTFKLKK